MGSFATVRTQCGRLRNVVWTGAYTVREPAHKSGLTVENIDDAQALLYWNGNVQFSVKAAIALAEMYPHINKAQECYA